jgi:hypothetical protein
LEFGVYGKSLLPDGQWLMEIKTSGSIPVWLCKLLSEYKIYPVSFSKYGTEYKRSLPPDPMSRHNCACASAMPGCDESFPALAQ